MDEIKEYRMCELTNHMYFTIQCSVILIIEHLDILNPTKFQYGVCYQYDVYRMMRVNRKLSIPSAPHLLIEYHGRSTSLLLLDGEY